MVLESKNALIKKYGDEKVFVVPFDSVKSIPDKFTRISHDKGIWSKFDSMGKYIYRYDAEGSPEFQQIIPYTLIQNPLNKKYFVYERTGGESRLNSMLSIGSGGHIDSSDGYKDVVFQAFLRELHEELDIDIIGKAECVGYVRDLNSSTNDHTGCVVKVDATKCKIKETDKMKGQWMSYDELEKNYHKFESWGKHIIDYMCGNNGVL